TCHTGGMGWDCSFLINSSLCQRSHLKDVANYNWHFTGWHSSSRLPLRPHHQVRLICLIARDTWLAGALHFPLINWSIMDMLCSAMVGCRFRRKMKDLLPSLSRIRERAIWSRLTSRKEAASLLARAHELSGIIAS